MKGRGVAFVGVLCIASLIVSGAYAGKPTDKPGKPPKPGNVTTECIVFTDDLEGGQEVEDCCPNAGPFPPYTMYLSFPVGDLPAGTYVGQLFMSHVRTRENRQWIIRYLVQFWTWDWDNETPGNGDFFFEIFADEEDIVNNETTDVLTVTVENGTAAVSEYFDMNDCDPCDPTCDLCYGFVPTCCDDFCDPDCRPYPCHEHITIEDVSFIMTRTSDLSYCQ